MTEPVTTTAVAPVLVCRKLGKVFKDFWLRPRVEAVVSVDLEVRPGEVFGLLGPNGSGKSTILKLMLGLLHPTSGTVEVFGRPPGDLRARARLGFLPEETDLYPYLDAREILDFYARLFRMPRAERRARIETLIRMVGLESAADRPIGEYSKGMKRRIGLAQALINDPDLLVLDEPTNGLDPVATREVKDLILELRARGKTILISSHLLADLEQICDRVAILYGGSVRALGTLRELLADSRSAILRTDPLPPETVARIAALIRAEGRAFHGAEAPRRSLEWLFLRIIEEAEGEGAATSGALRSGGTAEFLAAKRADGAATHGTDGGKR